MMTLVRKLNTNALITAILIIILGFAMLISPRQVYRVSVMIIIGYLLIMGLMAIFNGFRLKKTGSGSAYFPYGIFYLVIAGILYFYADKIVKTVPFILGIIIMLAGFSHLFQLSSNSAMKNVNKLPIIIYSCVLIAISLFFIFQSVFSLIVIFRLYGITLIVTGVIELLLLNYLKKPIKEEPKEVDPI